MRYPKIKTLYKRGSDFGVDVSSIADESFGLINKWLITEKIDGTNVRIMRVDGEWTFRGRSDKATWALRPSPLKVALTHLLPDALLNEVFDPGADIILFGEGYGAGIQGGGVYRPDPSFRLFDVKIANWWMMWDDVEKFAEGLGIKTAPVLAPVSAFPLSRAALSVMIPHSVVAQEESGDDDVMAEGVVARTDPPLFTRNGGRCVWKLKFKDFKAPAIKKVESIGIITDPATVGAIGAIVEMGAGVVPG